ncbi:MAG: hypothetical protein EOO10_01925 [Chitinophagaceae bacterium]|nr:MAG: hypothetical protein EOO10_01925 [Chitinophagaceae bacterium]
MKHKVLLVLIFLLAVFAEAQEKNLVDGVFETIQKMEDNHNKIKALLTQAEIKKDTDIRNALRYGKAALALSERLSHKPGIIGSLETIAELNSRLGNHDSSLLQYNQALIVARSLGDSLKVGILLFNIGSTYRTKGELQTAIEYCLQAKKRIEASGDRSWMAKMYNGLQLLYYYLPDYNKAIQFGKEAVFSAREIHDQDLLIKALSNLSMPYKDRQELDTSRQLLLESYTLARQTNDLHAQSAILLNLAGVFLEEKNYQAVKQYANQSLQLNKSLETQEGVCTSLRAMAISHLQTKEYDSAKYYAEAAISIADANNYTYEKASCLKTLSNIYYAMGNVDAGENYYNLSDDMFEQLFREENQASAARYEKLFEAEKKDNQILLQQANIRYKSVWNAILAVGIATILIISFLVYRNYYNRQKLQQRRITELETEKQLAATEAVLKGEEQERTRLAKDLHDGLGGMLSGIKYSLHTMKGNLIMTAENAQAFERSIDMLDSSIAEMRRVAHNMMPEALVKFGLDTALKDFCNDINQTGALNVTYQSIGLNDVPIEQTKSVTVYRIVQELLNNTIKHASATNALVQLTYDNSQLTITVEDDGKGFETAILKGSKGIGWINIQNRIEFLKGKWDVDSHPGKGTSVNIVIDN